MQGKCPRCAHEELDLLLSSPVPEVWSVLQCQRCFYGWRTSEPARRTDPGTYPDSFKMTSAQISNAPEIPSIPALRSTP